MSRDPFKSKIEKVINEEWAAGKFLDFDQSSVDPRFVHDDFEDEKKAFRYRWLGVVLLGIFIILFSQLVNLQALKRPYYLALAEGNRLREQKILAPRGIIYDQYGETLTKNAPSFELVVTPLDLPSAQNDLDRVTEAVVNFFGLRKDQVAEIVNKSEKESYNPITISQAVGKEKAILFITQQENFPGFSIQNTPQRDYMDGEVFAHILGYTGKLNSGEYEKFSEKGYLFNDLIGKNGLESTYENELRGTLGEKLVEVDARGVEKNTFQQKDPKPGNDLHLNIDAEFQKVLYESLNKQLKTHRATRGAAVALDPKTGGVLAMVSLPSFDNNWFARGITPDQYRELFSNQNLPLFNRATSGTYPPGSTVKPVLAIAALEEGVVNLQTKINDTGQLVVPNQFDPNSAQVFRGWNPAGLGPVNVYEAISMSSDIYFYTIGGGQRVLKIEGLGSERLASYLKDFYFGEITGIDLPTEKAGLIPTPDWKKRMNAGNGVEEKWYLGDTYNMSIGQGFLLVTPLQLAVATAAIANNGFVFKPQIVRQVTDQFGRVLADFKPTLLHRVSAKMENIKAAQEGMRLAVTSGTARQLAGLPINVAGKTGTSQFDGSNLSRTHAWFTSYAPYENPSIVLTVLIEAGGEGSSAAVPVARDVFDWYGKNRPRK